MNNVFKRQGRNAYTGAAGEAAGQRVTGRGAALGLRRLGSPSRRAFMIGTAAATTLAATVPAIPALAAEADDFSDTLDRRREFITGGEVAATEPGLADKRAAIDAQVGELIDTFNSAPGRTHLWPGLTVGAASNTEEVANMGVTANQITMLATAWASAGSKYFANADLLKKIQGALAFLSGQFRPNRSRPGNWWFWEIGIPRQVADTLTLLGEDGPEQKIFDILIAACRYHAPDPNVRRDYTSVKETGANRVDKALSCIVRGLLTEDESDIELGRDALSDTKGGGKNSLFGRVTSGDGFYADGSFIQHGALPYSGTYGEVAIRGVGEVLAMLAGSPWAVTDPGLANLLESIQLTFAPFQWGVRAMDTTRGRAVSRQAARDYDSGFAIASSVAVLAQAAAETDRATYLGLVKGWLERTTDQDVASNSQDLADSARLLAIAKDDGISAAPALNATINTYHQERIVAHRGEWAAVTNTSSKRIGRYEWGNNENNTGWYQGDGMLFLYHATDPGQFSDDFWPTVDPYALPGITANSEERKSGKGDGTGIPGADNEYAGGFALGDIGTTAMDLHNATDTLAANKSWFYFADSIVCLGSAIADTSGTAVRTVVENRSFPQGKVAAVMLDGAAATVDTSPTEATSAHIAGHAGFLSLSRPDSDPVPFAVRSQARTGTWEAINSGGDTGGSDEEVSRDYLRIEFAHDDSANWYAYAVLPQAGADAVNQQAANPSMSVIAAAENAHIASEGGAVMGHFFAAGEAAGYQADGPCAFGHRTVTPRTRAAAGAKQTQVVVSQPTKEGGTVVVTFPFDAPGTVADQDEEITVTQTSPLTLSVDVDSDRGNQHLITFASNATPEPVTVNFVDADGEQLADPVILTGELGAAYQAEAAEVAGYEVSGSPENASGVFAEDPITVTFVYEPVDAGADDSGDDSDDAADDGADGTAGTDDGADGANDGADSADGADGNASDGAGSAADSAADSGSADADNSDGSSTSGGNAGAAANAAAGSNASASTNGSSGASGSAGTNGSSAASGPSDASGSSAANGSAGSSSSGAKASGSHSGGSTGAGSSGTLPRTGSNMGGILAGAAAAALGGAVLHARSQRAAVDTGLEGSAEFAAGPGEALGDGHTAADAETGEGPEAHSEQEVRE